MLFQGSALFDSLKVWENVAFGLIQGRRMKRDQAKQIALDKLGQVGLGPEVAELSPAELSGGMQQRVALARAIAAEPEPNVCRSEESQVGQECVTPCRFRCCPGLQKKKQTTK